MLKGEIIGNLGHGAEVLDLQGKKYLKLNVAHNDGRDDNKTTEWVSVLWTAYGDPDRQKEYFPKGAQVYCSGSIKIRRYTDRNGSFRASLDMRATEVQLLGSREAQDATDTAATVRGAAVLAAQQAVQQSATSADLDEDMPF